MSAMLSVNSVWYSGHGQKALNEAKNKYGPAAPVPDLDVCCLAMDEHIG